MISPDKRFSMYAGLVIVTIGARVAYDAINPAPAPIKLYRVRGTVMLDKAPAAGVFINAYCEDQPYVSMAVSNERGEFEFVTAGRPGALARKHHATAVKFSPENISDEMTETNQMKVMDLDDNGMATRTRFAKESANELRHDYKDPAKSGLDFVVAEHDQNEVHYALK